MKSLSKFAIGIAMTGVATAAFATVRASNNYPANFSTSAATALVPITNVGGTTINFNLPAAGKKVLTFSAECAVDAPAGDTNSWVDLDIFVNGVVVAPTFGSSDAFCGSNGTAGFDGWIRPSITVAIQGKQGANSVSIQVRLNNAATGAWVSDSSIVIHD